MYSYSGFVYVCICTHRVVDYIAKAQGIMVAYVKVTLSVHQNDCVLIRSQIPPKCCSFSIRPIPLFRTK